MNSCTTSGNVFSAINLRWIEENKPTAGGRNHLAAYGERFDHGSEAKASDFRCRLKPALPSAGGVPLEDSIWKTKM